ncbi:maleylpyruvate isomerase N-terminal domain-containing protein [Nocardioides sp. KIGAM211]|uniref:Maleylpyruvate isomerase N-terminal domain-containing protein n=1 Tax=Nocardioides luti TaxID=2761101 RepID=A0A7X0RFB4_9ACTN|nr:maleylpyruvate isomerase N-terminal domain-containing protein [Nocardioides luti]MBB6626018.1 maleylpyruvate isomerase N-terminal domain-containing protein [Nocardioides luti]
MTLTFAGTLDHAAVVRAVDALVDLVAAPEVAERWEQESVLPGMTLGGLVRHLVSQPECAVAFLGHGSPPHAQVLSLADYFERVDWLLAPVDAPENTSIRDDFNEMAGPGVEESRGILERSRSELGAAIAAAGPAVYVPWQDCSLERDDFLVVRLMELVVHADDLAVSLGRPTPAFEPEVLEPVLALLAALAARRRGQDDVLRALARTERAGGPVSAF